MYNRRLPARRVSFYFVKRAYRAEQVRQGRKPKRGVGPLIAIVDDDESVREALQSLFKSIGFQTELFACAQDFLDSSHIGDLSCLILDVIMPGMTGLELQHQLATRQLIPIVFIAGQADQTVRDTAMRAGAVGFLPKPFSEDSLLTAVHTALEKCGYAQSRFRPTQN